MRCRLNAANVHALGAHEVPVPRAGRPALTMMPYLWPCCERAAAWLLEQSPGARGLLTMRKLESGEAPGSHVVCTLSVRCCADATIKRFR